MDAALISSVLETKFFSDIPNLNEALVLSKFDERRFVKHQVLFHQGESANELFIVKSGSLQIYIQENDRIIVLGHQFPGEAIGELEVIHHDNHRLASVSAIETAVLWMIKKPDLEELIALYPGLLRKFFFVVSERLAQADRKISYLVFLDTRLRVANLLLELYDNFGLQTENGYLINWKITQQHFANMLGVTRESAARALLNLEDKGIIHVQNRYITLCNLAELRQIAQEPQSSGSREWHSAHKYDIGF